MACEWDVSLTTERGAVPELYSQDALSADDTLETIADGLVLHTVTDYDREGITVVTDPGATLRVEVALDANYSDADPNPEQWIYWVGQDGVARWGASSNPVDFTPTAE